ncbi:MAG: hypothetical protein WCF47_10520 [Pseudolabrys sp.]
MPALAFLAVAGLVLVALLLVAGATLEPSLPPIVTSDRVGLPEPWHSDDIQTFAPTPAPAPEAVQPQSAPDPAKIESAARAARAEAPPKKKPVTQQPDHQQNHFHQDNLVDRFSIRGQ